MIKSAFFTIMVFLSTHLYAQTFTRITSGAIVNNEGASYGVAWGDYDNDGFIDLYVANGGGEDNDFLYHNNGDGTFTRITSGSIVHSNGWSHSGSWGDYDNDGDLDLFVSESDSNNSLHSNNGDGTFTKIDSGVIANSVQGVIGTWGDYDNDGYLDLYVAGKPSLFHNSGDGTFTDVTAYPLSAKGIRAGGCNWVDYDNDGDLDLFVVNNQYSPNNLFRNDGDMGFVQIFDGEIVNDYDYSNSSSWADYDNDGDLDVFIANGNSEQSRNNFLYQNNGDGTFTKITTGDIVNDGGNSYSSSWADFDNDGDLDLFVSNDMGDDGRTDFLYSNNGDGTFTKMTSGVIVETSAVSLGSGWADYNNDGFLDLFVAVDNGINNLLYQNNGNSNNWINIKCAGTISNASAIGAKVRLKAHIFGKDVWQLRELSGQTGAGLGSQNSLNAEFGLGDAIQIDSLIIEWPSGIVQDTTNIAINQFLTITETTTPNIWVSYNSFNFGSVFIGKQKARTLTVYNYGFDTLQVSNIVSDLPEFSIDTTHFSLGLGDSLNIEITFTAGETGEFSGLLTINSNDPDRPIATIELSGECILPPEISVSPESMTAELLTNDSTQQVLTITNNGASDLTYEISIQETKMTKTTNKKQTTTPLYSIKPDELKSYLSSIQKTMSSFNRSKNKNIKPVNNIVSEPAWQLLYTDPDEKELLYNIHNIYGGITGNELLFKLESFNPWSDTSSAPFGAIYIDADQDTSTGENSESGNQYGWYLGTDYAIFYFGGLFINGFYKWNSFNEEYEMIDTLTTNISENNSKEIIVGINRSDLETSYVINMAAQFGESSNLDQIPDKQMGHITYHLPPSWLNLSSTGGTIPAGSHQDITVTFDATRLYGGTYDANIIISNNDPADSEIVIPVHLDVTGRPLIAVESDSLDFGEAYVDIGTIKPFIIQNIGTEVLEISDINIQGDGFSKDTFPPSINPLSQDTVWISFLPDAVADYSGNLTINSNDATNSSISVDLFGKGVIPPAISTDPDSFSISVVNPARTDTTVMLTISNNGGSDLIYNIEIQNKKSESTETVTIRNKYPESFYEPLAKGESDNRVGPAIINGHGGPDNFGYRWIDSDESAGPSFNWIEINSIGNQIVLDDDATVYFFDLGFDFNFYGETFDQIAISSNGWLSFTNTTGFNWNTPLPNSSEFVPENVIALWAYDLHPGSGSCYYYKDVENNRFIVEYENWSTYDNRATYLSMQAILYKSGKIVFQYKDVQQTIDFGTIGIQNGDKTDGLTIAFNSEYIKNNLAVEIKKGAQWLSVEPSSGTIAAGNDENINLKIDSEGLANDTYSTWLKISTNVPGYENLYLPVKLKVDLITSLDKSDVKPNKIYLAQNYPNPFNPSTTIKYNLPAPAKVSIVIYDILGREVVRLVKKEMPVGYHQVIWDGKNNQGNRVGSGMYIYYMCTSGSDGHKNMTQPRKLILLK